MQVAGLACGVISELVGELDAGVQLVGDGFGAAANGIRQLVVGSVDLDAVELRFAVACRIAGAGIIAHAGHQIVDTPLNLSTVYQEMKAADSASTGVVAVESPFPFCETVQRLTAAFVKQQIKVFAVIDQQAEALSAGLNMPPTILMIFGSPKAGTPLMLAQPVAGIDLPLKLLVSEADVGRVLVYFNAAAYLIERHGLPPELAANLLAPERLIAATLSVEN